MEPRGVETPVAEARANAHQIADPQHSKGSRPASTEQKLAVAFPAASPKGAPMSMSSKPSPLTSPGLAGVVTAKAVEAVFRHICSGWAIH